MPDNFLNIFHNKILAASILSWILAQTAKFVFGFIVNGRPDLTLLTKSGGMPSGHAALMSSVSWGIGEAYGFSSGQFALASVMSIIVMYDAAGVRQAVGVQAQILNDLIYDVYRGTPAKPSRIREILGHTPVEVIAGAFLGIAVAMLF